ncbi:MAG TPA: MFS transporter [Chloroflexota bacterium]
MIGTAGGYRSVLANRAFLALWLAQVLSQIADNLLYFVLLVEVYKQTGSNTAVSGLVLSFTLPALTIGLLAGVLVDRADKRAVLLLTNLARAAIALMFIFSTSSLPSVFTLGLLTSAVRQLFMPAEAATLPRLLPQRDLLTANSLFTLTYNASFIVGFAGAGPLLKIAGPDAVFVVAAAFFLLSAALVWTLPKTAVDSQLELPPSALDRSRLVVRELLEGWAFLRSGPEILRVMLQLAFAWSLTGVIAAIAPGYATTVLGLSEEDAFFLVVPAGIGVVLGSLLIGRFGGRVDRALLIASGLLGMGLAVILLAVYRRLLDQLLPHVPPQITFDVHPGGLSGFLIAVMLFAALLGLANAAATIPANTTIQEGTPDDLRGRVFSVLNTLGNLGSTAPVLLVGVLADLLGVGRLMLLVGAGIFAIGALSAVPFLRRGSRIATTR